MNKTKTLIFLYLILYLNKTRCLRCPGRNLQNCKCQREFQLPGNKKTNLLCPNIGIHDIDITFYEFGQVNFVCSTSGPKYAGLLPTLDLSKTQKLKMNDCDSFTEFDYILNKLNLTDIKQLYVSDVPPRGSNTTENINEESFALLKNLEILDYSYSRVLFNNDFLKNIPKLLELYINDVGLMELEINFEYVTNLRKINLSMNKISSITDEGFKNLTDLTELYLDNNKIELLQRNALLGLKKLKLLNLSNNYLVEVPREALSSLKDLRIINFSGNRLAKIIEEAFANNNLLLSIAMQNNKLQYIAEESFQNCSTLLKLNLGNNQLETLPENIFQNLKLLIYLNLSANKLSTLPASIFSSLANLKRLNLSNNKIRTFNMYVPPNKNMELNLAINEIAHYPGTNLKVKKLDLSFNKIKKVAIGDIATSSISYVDLEYNHVQHVEFNTTIMSNASQYINLMHNNLEPDCFNYHIVNYYNKEKNMTEPLLNIVGITLKPEDIYCLLPEDCPDPCSCYYKPFNTDLIVNCSFKNLSSFSLKKSVFSLPEYILKESNGKASRNLTHVTHLDLSGNSINTFNWVSPFIKEVNLKNNKISSLDHEVLELFRSSRLERLELEGNPWECNCESITLQTFLKEFHDKTDALKVYCKNTRTALIQIHDLCKISLHLSILLSIGLGTLLCCAMLAVIFFVFPMEIKSYLYERQWLLRWITEKDLDRDKTYDVFISYANQDEAFVVDNLLFKLEYDNAYKVCIHVRDWIPGELIMQQIINSVQNSRRTLIVLSNNFLESVWGKMEFRAAHTRAMQEGRTRVIVVIYGGLDENKLDDELKNYLRTNTYIKWGDKWFWNKLRYALPHHKRDGMNEIQR